MAAETATAGASPYLDSLAKSLDGSDPAPETGPGTDQCGQWAMRGTCEEGHFAFRALLCGREWCADCGAKDSDAHKRRWQRWLPKVQRLAVIGYLVVTFPEPVRLGLRTKDGLRAAQQTVTDLLRSHGWWRGLRRWHFFGDHGGTFHPHLNYLLDSGYIDKRRLASLKRDLRAAFGRELVIHYQFASEPAKLLHLIKYVTRATFTDYQWDRELASNLYNFRNTWCWGKWNDPIVWEPGLPPDDADALARDLAKGNCPRCHSTFSWGGKPVPISLFDLNEACSLGLRYYLYPPADDPQRRPPDLAIPS